MTFLAFARFSHKGQWTFDSRKVIFMIKDNLDYLKNPHSSCIATFENSTLIDSKVLLHTSKMNNMIHKWGGWGQKFMKIYPHDSRI